MLDGNVSIRATKHGGITPDFGEMVIVWGLEKFDEISVFSGGIMHESNKIHKILFKGRNVMDTLMEYLYLRILTNKI